MREKREIGNLLTSEELAQKLRVDLSWVYRHTMSKGPNAIPRLQVGKYIRFSESDVLEWLQQQQAE